MPRVRRPVPDWKLALGNEEKEGRGKTPTQMHLVKIKTRTMSRALPASGGLADGIQCPRGHLAEEALGRVDKAGAAAAIVLAEGAGRVVLVRLDHDGVAEPVGDGALWVLAQVAASLLGPVRLPVLITLRPCDRPRRCKEAVP